MGIRQMVRREIGDHPLVRFNVNASAGAKSYGQELLSNQWCLTAPGMGFGVRIVDYVASGCIPVVVRPGRLSLPYEPDLDYGGFAVSVRFDQIASLPALLDGMSDEQIRRKRERLREVHRLFIWDEEYGRAYEYTRELTLRRLNATASSSGIR